MVQRRKAELGRDAGACDVAGPLVVMATDRRKIHFMM